MKMEQENRKLQVKNKRRRTAFLGGCAAQSNTYLHPAEVFFKAEDSTAEEDLLLHNLTCLNINVNSVNIRVLFDSGLLLLLLKMERDEIIERAPTSYINPVVILAKNDGSIRMCLDAREINKNLNHVMNALSRLRISSEDLKKGRSSQNWI